MKNKLILLVTIISFVFLAGSSSHLSAQAPETYVKANKPDLAVTSLTALYNTVKVNVNNKFKATIKNKGKVASPACKKMIQRGGAKEYTDLPAMAPGEVVTITFYAKFSKPQNYRVTVMADSGETVDEIIENNNSKYVTFTVVGEDRVTEKLKITGKLAIRMYSETNIRREETFYLYFNNIPANDITIKVDDHLLALRPGVPGGYHNATNSPYSLKSTVGVVFKKLLSTTPDVYQTLASATGTINNPVMITAPPPGFKLDIDNASHLTVSWSPSSDSFGLVISKVIKNNGSLSQQIIHSVGNISGNSTSIPVSVFEKGKEYVISLHQYMSDLTLSGNYAPGSRISNMIFQFRNFETK